MKRGWIKQIQSYLVNLKINLGFEEIKPLSNVFFMNLVKKRAWQRATENLVSRQQRMKKGKTIKYDNRLALQDYLRPNKVLTLDQQKLLFSLRCETNLNHIETKVMCELGCMVPNNNQHIYICKYVSDGIPPSIPYDKIFNGFLHEKAEVATRMERNLARRKYLIEQQYLKY